MSYAGWIHLSNLKHKTILHISSEYMFISVKTQNLNGRTHIKWDWTGGKKTPSYP